MKEHRFKSFTIIELLVVITIIIVLATLVFLSLTKAKEQTKQISCINNLRQLTITMALYSIDANDRLPSNGYGHEGSLMGRRLWVVGDEHINPASFTNLAYLLDPQYALFAEYVKESLIYKCPSDKGKVPVNDKWIPHLRSYALNSYIAWTWPPATWNSPRYQWFYKLSDLARVGPSQILTFIDTAPGNICHSAFVIYKGSGLPGLFYHIPSTQHAGKGTIAFGDAHVELKRWQDPWTLEMSQVEWLPNHLTLYSPGNVDLIWLQEHATVPR